MHLLSMSTETKSFHFLNIIKINSLLKWILKYDQLDLNDCAFVNRATTPLPVLVARQPSSSGDTTTPEGDQSSQPMETTQRSDSDYTSHRGEK